MLTRWRLNTQATKIVPELARREFKNRGIKTPSPEHAQRAARDQVPEPKTRSEFDGYPAHKCLTFNKTRSELDGCAKINKQSPGASSTGSEPAQAVKCNHKGGSKE